MNHNLPRSTRNAGAKLKALWSKNRYLCWAALVLLVFILPLVCGPSLGNAIQAAALVILVLVTGHYAASTKDMAREAERSRRQVTARYEHEKTERQKAALFHLVEEAKMNMEIFLHYNKPSAHLSDEVAALPAAAREQAAIAAQLIGQPRSKPKPLSIFSFLHFFVAARDQLPAAAPSLGDLTAELHEMYFVMAQVNALIDEYHLRGTTVVTPSTMFHQIQRSLGQRTSNHSNFLALLRHITQRLDEIKSKLLADSEVP